MSRGVSRHICLIAIMTPDVPHAEIKNLSIAIGLA